LTYSDPNLNKLLSEREEKRRATGEITFIKKDRSKFVAEVSSVIFLDKNNEELSSMVIRDLTEQKQAEEALKQSEEELNFAQEIAGMGSWKLNLQSNMINCSRNFLKLIRFNKNKTEFSFEIIRSIIFQEDKSLFDKNINEVITTQKPVSFDIRIVDYEGNIKWLQNNIVPVLENNILVAIHGVNIDITEKKIIEQELLKAKENAVKSNQLKTAFLNNISHEIRTPLNGILGFGNLILEKDLSDEEKKLYYDILENSSNRLIKTITDIMDISLLVSGNVVPKIEKYSIANILEDIYILFENNCKKKNIKPSLQYGFDLENSCIFTDATLLKKAIIHLLDNAVKFSKEGGEVVINVERINKELVIYIKDTGVGINPEKLESLFDYFIQEDVSDTRRYEGAGLGLSIPNRLVKLLDGRIHITSEKGKGSVFYIYISDNNTYKCNEEMYKNHKNVKILVAEDDDDNYMLIENYFKKNNIDFIRANDGLEAVELTKKNPDISLIMMDLKMSKMSGLEATKIIKTFNKNIPIIAVTAYSMLGDEFEAFKSGCDDFIEKPINKNILKKKFDKFGINIYST